MTSQEKLVVTRCMVTFKSFRDNAIGPAMKKMATTQMAECIWALGMEEWDGVKGEPPPGRTIEAEISR